MFELPEVVVLSSQMNKYLQGKTILEANLGNSPHKFVWYNRSPEEFNALCSGRKFGKTEYAGRWMISRIGEDYSLVLGETGGKLLLHQPGEAEPKKYHFMLRFTDESSLSLQVQMWGGIELYPRGEENNCKYIKDAALTPLDPRFSRDYFESLIQTAVQKGKRSVKSLLVQEQTIPGLGNSCAQDIMLVSRLHPKRDLSSLSLNEIVSLYDAILEVINKIIVGGGRNDETDLLGAKGSYERILDASTVGKPCKLCGNSIQKIQYLGGASYFCPGCQKLSR